MCQQQKEEEVHQHWRYRWCIDTTTRRLSKKFDYSRQKQYRQQSFNKTKITRKQNGKKNNSMGILNGRQNLDIAKKGKS